MRNGGGVGEGWGVIVKVGDDGLPEGVQFLGGENADIAFVYGAEGDVDLGSGTEEGLGRLEDEGVYI